METTFSGQKNSGRLRVKKCLNAQGQETEPTVEFKTAIPLGHESWTQPCSTLVCIYKQIGKQ